MSGYFKKLSTLLGVEKTADQESYSKATVNTSAADRRTLGLTWYPIAIRNTEIGRGDYLTVEVERTTNTDLSHQFRFGSSVALFSNHEAKTDRIEGIVSHQSAGKMKISLRVDELPDWSRDGKLGVDLLFDNNSYDEMLLALKQAEVRSEQSTSHELIPVLTGISKPQFEIQSFVYSSDTLNESQNDAVNKILSAKQLAVIHGPPGTGKTTTLVQAIKALNKQQGKKILVVAPSNTAVDLLTEKLTEEGLNVIRVGNPARVSEKLMHATLDAKMAVHPEMKTVKELKKRAAEYKNMAHKYKRNFGRAEREQRKALFDEAHKIVKEVDQIEQYISEQLFEQADVVTATLVGANHYTVKSLKYHTVVIDEAGQALEPACWIPILKAEKVVLAGDPFQLSPTIKSVEAGKQGLNTTLLEKCIRMYPESVVLLNVQYRMNSQIMEYSSRVFYQDALRASPSVAGHILFPGAAPFMFIDTAGCGFEEKSEGTSTTNPEEAGFLFRHLNTLVEEIKDAGIDFPSIALISPYKQQVELLKELQRDYKDLETHKNMISINSIDGFQGQERDVVYISLARSNTEGNIGFLSDIRRMNVAMTRARKKLVIIGDGATLSRASFYSELMKYAEEQHAYYSAWTFMDL